MNGATRVCGDRPRRISSTRGNAASTSKSSLKFAFQAFRISTGRPDGSTILPEAHRSVPEHVGTM